MTSLTELPAMTNLRQNAKCHCFFRLRCYWHEVHINTYLLHTGSKHDVIKVSALLNRINKDRRFHSITAVSEKKRRRKVYILVAFGETFPTIYNMPTCDHPMGGILRFYLITLRNKLSGAVYCNRSCLWACLQRAAGRAVSKPYYSQRARSVCVSLSGFFHFSCSPTGVTKSRGNTLWILQRP